MKYYDDLIYDSKLLDYIQDNVSLTGVVRSYFDESSIKVYPGYKFFFNKCPNHNISDSYHSFYVDEMKGLYYCFGCGCAGSSFEFVMDCFNLDINKTTEVLGSIINVFNKDLLDDDLCNIVDKLTRRYDCDDLIKESKDKNIYLNDRVERYFNNSNLDNLDITKVSNRLCCSEEFVKNKYMNTEYYKAKVKVMINEKNSPMFR